MKYLKKYENFFNQFKKESLIKESAILVDGSPKIIGTPGVGTHNAKDWQSRNAWDVEAPEGTVVYSITNGEVRKVRKRSNQVKKDGVKKLYGDQISISSDGDTPDVFYTHINTSLQKGDKVKIGDTIGTIVASSGIPPHVHVGLSSGNLSDLTNLSSAIGGTLEADVAATAELSTDASTDMSDSSDESGSDYNWIRYNIPKDITLNVDTSIVDWCISKGIPYDKGSRAQYAAKLGIDNYRYLAGQNIEMLKLLKRKYENGELGKFMKELEPTLNPIISDKLKPIIDGSENIKVTKEELPKDIKQEEPLTLGSGEYGSDDFIIYLAHQLGRAGCAQVIQAAKGQGKLHPSTKKGEHLISNFPGGISNHFKRKQNLKSALKSDNDTEAANIFLNAWKERWSDLYKEANEPGKVPDEIGEIIKKYSAEFGIPYDFALAMCYVESRFDPKAHQKDSSYHGLFQITYDSFNHLKPTGSEKPDIYNANDNAYVGLKQMKNWIKEINKYLRRGGYSEPSGEDYLSQMDIRPALKNIS